MQDQTIQAKAKVKAKAQGKAKANSLASEARSAEKILLLQNWRAQRGEKICNARLGHLFSLVSGARSAEKILHLQFWRAPRGEKFLQRWTRSPVFSGIRRAQRGENFATLVQVTGQVRLGHPFSLVSGARSAEKILP